MMDVLAEIWPDILASVGPGTIWIFSPDALIRAGGFLFRMSLQERDHRGQKFRLPPVVILKQCYERRFNAVIKHQVEVPCRATLLNRLKKVEPSIIEIRNDL